MVDNLEKIREIIGELPVEQRQVLLRELEKCPEKLEKRRHRSFYNIVKAAVKGVATGASIAGIVNTVAPGVIPTFLGYLVGHFVVESVCVAGKYFD